jgi:prepilin-type N-terminal cleavage/methylation domain-containing protein
MSRRSSLKNKKGFTLVELIIVIAVLAVLAAIVTPLTVNAVERSKTAADQATLSALNTTTLKYGLDENKLGGDIFAGFNTDQARMQELVDKGFLSAAVAPQHAGTAFLWQSAQQKWAFADSATTPPLTSLGSSFTEISNAMIDLITQRYISMGRYGRNWGDYAYTDLGLKPSDWANPVLHIYFKPGGSLLRIRPEQGYTFYIKDLQGNTKKLPYSYSWDLIHDAQDNKWYYHSVAAANLIDISTLEIKP